ncbi:bis(5'-adenosyl)-triphosphatase enpp4-like isoform X3 [Dreissena polymorpha]|nr:bis(5'-adenosyl)-triphosphatase enpp4-like isoform X3 [Dreissena polymorpha]
MCDISLLISCVLFLTMTSSCEADAVHNVLLISFDGFRWDYYKKANNLTNIHRMIADGGWAVNGTKNVFITKTLPNHFTMVTGLYEETHGIVGNVMYDPVFNATYYGMNTTIQSESRWYTGEPIWVTNQRQRTDYRSGCVCWPSSGAVLEGFRPYQHIPWKTAEDFPYKERFKTAVKWFTDHENPTNLVLVYIDNPDIIGHTFGPDSDELIHELLVLDEALGYLFDLLIDEDLLKKTDIILTSDHGMASIPKDDSYKIDLTKYLTPGTYFVTDTSPTAGIFPTSPEFEDAIFHNLSSIQHAKVYRKANIPTEFHFKNNRRTPPIVVIPEEHYWCSDNNTYIAGNHGYSNDVADMHPFFAAMGPSFKKGSKVMTFNSVDVYPMLCAILGLKPAPNNGSMDVVAELLVDRLKENTGSTFGTYIFILIVGGLVSGVFAVAACQVQRQLRRRRYQSHPIHKLPKSMMIVPSSGKEDAVIGLLSDMSDEEF